MQKIFFCFVSFSLLFEFVCKATEKANKDSKLPWIRHRYYKCRPNCFFSFLQDNKRIETEEGNYEVSKTAIKDKSMLSSQAQKLCENIDAYWMTPVCSAPDDSDMCK